jgi:anthranilate synthase component 1
MILNLELKASDCYRYIKKIFPNSYLTEDSKQVIIGIDVNYLDSKTYSYEELRKFVKSQKGIADFSGLFGVFSYEIIHYFEDIKKKSNSEYYYPEFVFADAQAYLYFDKKNSSFSFFGDAEKYSELILNLKEGIKNIISNSSKNFKIISNEGEKKKIFLDSVDKAKEYIKKGDIFQVVLSSQIILESDFDPYDFYEELSAKNPSPYMFYFPAPYGTVIGSSPEILVKIENKQLFIAPIAGTKPRGKNAEEDRILADKLLNDEKELAEHRMLIDLARNDIGKFSKPGSIRVEDPMHIEYFQHVMHIVSNIYGELLEDSDIFDVLSTAFPAGTLSGAPKIRALEIIAELETHKRNIYGGGIGFLHYNGNSQIAIIIRTAFYKDKKYYIQSGAGIVYDSVPENEYLEILNKRKSLTGIFEKEENL